jgi:hypothetical protein
VFIANENIGTVEQYSYVDAARGAVIGLAWKINSGRQAGPHSLTVAQLFYSFEQRELAKEISSAATIPRNLRGVS